jgi:hypothetical protein
MAASARKPVGQTHKSSKVAMLYQRFEPAFVALMKHSEECQNLEFNNPDRKKNERTTARLVDAMVKARHAVIAAEAHSIEDMLLKIKAVGSASAYRIDTIADLDNWKPHERYDHGDEWEAVVSLRDDLRRYVRQQAAMPILTGRYRPRTSKSTRPRSSQSTSVIGCRVLLCPRTSPGFWLAKPW